MATIVPRKGKDGKLAFQVKIRVQGHPPQTDTFQKKTDATRWAQSIEAALRDNRFVPSSESKRHTVAELIDRYLTDVVPQKKDQRNPKKYLAWWKKKLGHLRIAAVTPAVIVEARDELARRPVQRDPSKKLSPASVVRHMAALSHAFSIAVREWQWLELNPFTRVSRPKEPRGRVRYLADEERERLLDACKGSGHPLLYAAVVLSLSTGARKGELLGLKWENVNLKAGRIALLDTKNGEHRGLPLAPHALQIMKELRASRKDSIPWVFPGRGGRKPIDLQVPWEAAVRAANLQDFRWHDLRHSAASYLAMNGATLAEIAAVLGHRQLDMVKRYAHLSPEHLAGVVTRMNASIFGTGLQSSQG